MDLSHIQIPLDTPLSSIGIFFLLACIPIFLLCFTSFIKLNIVFNILRNALGVGQIPSAAIVFIMSSVLSIYIFSPTLNEMQASITQVLNSKFKTTTSQTASPSVKKSNYSLDKLTFGDLSELADTIINPLKLFLIKNSRVKERIFFALLKEKKINQNTTTISIPCNTDIVDANCEIPGETLWTLTPAFLVSELRMAFIIGFMLYVPFLAIDLIIGNILLALHFTMLSPQVVSSPLKILLFVLSDAWYLLCKGLVL